MPSSASRLHAALLSSFPNADPAHHLNAHASSKKLSAQVTFEAPPGLKQNLSRTLASWPPEWLAAGGPTRAQLAFLLAWLHAVAQERRAHAPLAWARPYDFSAADLRAGTDLVCRATAAAAAARGGGIGGVDWAALRGLLEGAVYGGRVDSAYDLKAGGKGGGGRGVLAPAGPCDWAAGCMPASRGCGHWLALRWPAGSCPLGSATGPQITRAAPTREIACAGAQGAPRSVLQP